MLDANTIFPKINWLLRAQRLQWSEWIDFNELDGDKRESIMFDGLGLQIEDAGVAEVNKRLEWAVDYGPVHFLGVSCIIINTIY